MGHELGRNTIKRIPQENGLEPAPERSKKAPWASLLKAHRGAIAATDFVTVEVLTLRGLVRYAVLFVVDLKTRRVHVASIVRDPHGGLMAQVARNLTDPIDGVLAWHRCLIRDRDPLFTAPFGGILEQGGVSCVRLPARSPNLNAYAERFVRSIKSECLRRMIPLGERHLGMLVGQYVEHYHLERNHQGLGNELPEQGAANTNGHGAVDCRERLGGTLRFYHRKQPETRRFGSGTVRGIGIAYADGSRARLLDTPEGPRTLSQNHACVYHSRGWGCPRHPSPSESLS